MNKRFVFEAGNGYVEHMTAQQLVEFAQAEGRAAIRLAVILHTKTLLSDQEFLDIVRPDHRVRVINEWDTVFDDD